MPYSVKKRGKAWAVTNTRTGKVVAVRGSKKKAEASRRAREGARRR